MKGSLWGVVVLDKQWTMQNKEGEAASEADRSLVTAPPVKCRQPPVPAAAGPPLAPVTSACSGRRDFLSSQEEVSLLPGKPLGKVGLPWGVRVQERVRLAPFLPEAAGTFPEGRVLTPCAACCVHPTAQPSGPPRPVSVAGTSPHPQPRSQSSGRSLLRGCVCSRT